MDVGAWIGLAALVLAIPLGVASIFVYNGLMRQLQQRRLTRANETREQAIRTYKRIVAFRNGTKDKYAYYLMTVGWASVFAVASGAAAIAIFLKFPAPSEIPDLGELALLLIAIGCFVSAIVLLLVMYDTERKLENFAAYKSDMEKQWGVLE
jgi:hypothetical protein